MYRKQEIIIGFTIGLIIGLLLTMLPRIFINQTVSASTTLKTYYLGENILLGISSQYYFHGYKNDHLVIGHRSSYGGTANIYILDPQINQTFRVEEITYSIKHFDFTIPSITLEW